MLLRGMFSGDSVTQTGVGAARLGEQERTPGTGVIYGAGH